MRALRLIHATNERPGPLAVCNRYGCRNIILGYERTDTYGLRVIPRRRWIINDGAIANPARSVSVAVISTVRADTNNTRVV